MNFENEEQANSYMGAEAEGEAEARAANDAAIVEAETSDFEIIKSSLEVLRFKVGSEYVESKNIPAELMMAGIRAAERMQTDLDALREANAHKTALLSDLEEGLVPQNKDFEIIKQKYEAINQSTEKHFTTEDAEDLREILSAAECMAVEIKRLKESAFGLYTLLDNISTAGDMAKSNDEAFRRLAEAQLESMSNFGVTSDGFKLFFNGTRLVTRFVELEASRDEWKKQWEHEVSGRHLAEEEIAKLKDGYKVAHEFCETMRKENEKVKVELAAAKPITCGECKRKHTSECPRANFEILDKSDGDCCFTTNLKDNDYCSAAVRKETTA